MAYRQKITEEQIQSEVWRPIAGWAGYEVSSVGRVRRVWPCYMCHAVRHRILLPHAKGGYLTVMLQKARIRTGRAIYPTVHSLVAGAFLDPRPSSKHIINHKNGKKVDNVFTNLEWATSSENTLHAIALGLMPRIGGIAAQSQKIAPDDVRYIRASKKTNKVLASELDLSPEHVSGIRRGIYWKHVG